MNRSIVDASLYIPDALTATPNVWHLPSICDIAGPTLSKAVKKQRIIYRSWITRGNGDQTEEVATSRCTEMFSTHESEKMH
jgi:hypothetical protein